MTSPLRPDRGALRNTPTWLPNFFGARPPEAPRPLGLDWAYATAGRLERERAPLSGPGYRLYWMTTTTIASRDVLSTASSQLVVGRHSACHAVLEGDATIALRHLLVRSDILDDGCPRLRVLDLESGTGFLLPDGTRHRSITATGPLVLRVGAYAIVALPAGVALPERMPVPTYEPVDGRACSPSPRLSRITLMPSALMLAERPSLHALVRGQAALRTSEYELTLSTSAMRVTVDLSPTEIARGLLIGRASKCLDAGLRSILSNGISRVHLLLLRDGDECRAYDLASTQGSYLDRQPVAQALLEDGGTSLFLGTTTGIRLDWRRKPAIGAG
jgi:FHA domain